MRTSRIGAKKYLVIESPKETTARRIKRHTCIQVDSDEPLANLDWVPSGTVRLTVTSPVSDLSRISELAALEELDLFSTLSKPQRIDLSGLTSLRAAGIEADAVLPTGLPEGLGELMLYRSKRELDLARFKRLKSLRLAGHSGTIKSFPRNLATAWLSGFGWRGANAKLGELQGLRLDRMRGIEWVSGVALTPPREWFYAETCSGLLGLHPKYLKWQVPSGLSVQVVECPDWGADA